MKENVFDVLMYLFENYLDSESELAPDQESLTVELLEAGFPQAEVDKAFDWLEGLALQQNQDDLDRENNHSIRLFTRHEAERLDLECRGLLLFLEQRGILDPFNRELVLDRVMALDTEEISLEQLKWIILMVLFNQPGQEAAYTWMEDLLYGNVPGHLH